MASVNIGGGDDQFNRYKMPAVIGKVEGRGNGVCTRVVNLTEVARALHRPPSYICKFFGCELGAQTRMNDDHDSYIVNGSHNEHVLKEILQKFIEMFVLCANCRLPETDLKLKKNGDINQQCNACGSENICDMTHKLCTFIAKNPPDGKKKKSDGKRDKAARRALKAKKANGEIDEDDEKSRRKAEKAAKKAAKKAAESDDAIGMAGADVDFEAEFNNTFPIADDDDEVEWSVDTSKEAQEARMRELGGAASIFERANADEDREKARKLRNYIDEGKKPAKVISKSEKIFGEDETIQGIMFAAVVDEGVSTMVDSLTDRAIPVMAYLGKPMIEEAQKAYCNFLEWASNRDESIMPILPHILKLGYDSDIVEEEQILAWYKKEGGREDVRESVKVIIDWLEEGEEASDDDDDDDEEETDEE